MKIKIPKNIFYQVLFVLCIVVPYFDNFELTFGVWSLSAAVTLCRSYSVELLKQIFCFTAILIIAAVVTLKHDYRLYYIIRDFTYLLKPILGLLIGYQICKRAQLDAFRLIVITGVILAFLHFARLANAVVFHHARSVIEIRMYSGYFSDFEIYALIILLFHRQFNLSFPPRLRMFFILVIAASSFMYLARTNFIQFFILYIALKGYLTINRRSIIVVSSLTVAVLVGYSAILYVNPRRNGKGFEAFLYKVKIAPMEPFRTKINRDNWKEFHDNYRSYENIMTVRQMTGVDTGTVFYGKGLGSTVDLHRKMWLGNIQIQYISILHNGYMTVFLKSGLVGVLIFVISIYLLFKKRKTDIPIVRNINRLMLGTGIFMIISAWVFMGLYFLVDTKAVLIGLFFCSREFYLKQAAHEPKNLIQ